MSTIIKRILLFAFIAFSSLLLLQPEIAAQPLGSISIENAKGDFHVSGGLATGIACRTLLENCPVPSWDCENLAYQVQFDFGYNIRQARGVLPKVSVFATVGNNTNTDAVLTRNGEDTNFANSINSFLYGGGISASWFNGPFGVSVQYRTQRLITGPQLLDNGQNNNNVDLLDFGSSSYGFAQVGFKIRLGGGGDGLSGADGVIRDTRGAIERLRELIGDKKEDEKGNSQ